MAQISRELERALNAINSGIFVADANLEGIYCNKAYEDITGVSADNILGKTAATIVKEGWASNSVAVLCARKKCKISLIQNFPNDRTALVTGCPLYKNDGSLDMVVITVVDVTAQSELYENLLARRFLEQENEATLRKMIDKSIVRESGAMRETIAASLRAAFSDATVLITGETGTGKEVIANIIHKNSSRSNYNMIKVNCGAIPENLADAELFGYADGAFTGAVKGGKAGIFEMANHGMVFLDEISEMPLALQAKLLRVLQEHEIRRVGSTETVVSDFRLIAATNKDLRAMVSKGTFRRDLYYRINVIQIKIAPLRERQEDILPLLQNEIENLNKQYGRNVSFSTRAEKFFQQYYWPGNVRELKNTVERIFFSMDKDVIHLEDIDRYADTASDNSEGANTEEIREAQSLRMRVQEYERKIISETLKKCRTMKEAAEKLQIDPATLTRKCQAYQIEIK